MKRVANLSATVLLCVCFCANGSGVFEDSIRELIAIESNETSACIEVHNSSVTSGNWFVLGNCSDYESGVDFDYLTEKGCDKNATGMIRTRLDSSMCMQASHNGDIFQRGSWMRVYPCDKENKHQIFDVSRQIRLNGTGWCVAHRGQRALINEDQMVLRECNNVPYGWKED